MKKKKKKTTKRAKKAASRLEGDALRDELMRKEKREEERVLAVNTLFYRARAYNVSQSFIGRRRRLAPCRMHAHVRS